ncbi:MAG: tetratricopeptide repeat-containing sensor histidine kinase [Flavobacterium sp.]|nr:tetratricopeptide repeat-containing sensor histidine kinase [Flavobacterium sp.]
MKCRFYVWMLLLPFLAFGQKVDQSWVDSLLHALPKMKDDTAKVNQLNKITLHYIDTDSTKSFHYATKGLELSKKLKWKEGISNSNFCLGTFYDAHLKYDKALAYFNQALQTENQGIISKSLQSISVIYTNVSNYSKAIDYCFRALKIDEASGNKIGIAKITANLGSIYYGMKDYDKALRYLNKSAKMYEAIGNINELAWVYRNTAAVYNSLDQLQKALFYYKKADALSKKSKNKALQARILSGIALVYYNLEDYEKAIDNSRLSLKATNHRTEDLQTIAFCRGLLGDSYIEKAKSNPNNKILLDSALFNLNEAIKFHKQLNCTRDLVYDFTSLTKIHKLKGDYKRALISYETSTLYKDSIFNSNNKETIQNLEDKRAIELRDNQIKISKLQLESKEKQKQYLILGLLLLGIIGGLLWYQNRNRRKTNLKLQALNKDLDQSNKVKTRMLGILNHDLRSPVNSFIHFIQFQKHSPDILDAETKERIENDTIHSAKNLLNAMEDILLWTKNQMENFEPEPKTVSVNSLFDDTRNHFESEEKVKITFENSGNIQIYTDENYLKTIIRNLTGNAIKALNQVQNPTIIWKAWEENNQTFLSITDNGPGGTQGKFKALYDETEVVGIQSGLGLHLIRDLAKAIHCEILVKTKPNQGTSFILKFK